MKQVDDFTVRAIFLFRRFRHATDFAILSSFTMGQYRLYVKMSKRWRRLCEIEAESHAQAFRKAILCLQPEHYDKQIRLEQVEPKRK
jgi:hypothetical protein